MDELPEQVQDGMRRAMLQVSNGGHTPGAWMPGVHILRGPVWIATCQECHTEAVVESAGTFQGLALLFGCVTMQRVPPRVTRAPLVRPVEFGDVEGTDVHPADPE